MGGMGNLPALLLLVAGVLVLPLRGQSQPPPAAASKPAAQTSASADALYQMADEVASEVEKLRGWTFKRPVRKERTTVGEAKRYFESRIDVLLPPPRRAVMEAFLRTAGLIPAGAALRASLATVLEQQVAGYYDPLTGTLHLVDRADEMPTFMQRTVLAHELTHALDDQYAGLGDLDRTEPQSTEDADVVKGSLAEGSATALMLQYLVRETMAGRVNAGEAAAYFKKEMARAESLAQMPRYFNALFGSYLVGSAFLAKGNLQAVLTQPDNTAIGQNFLAAWKTPPRSSEQVLHPDKYWDASRADEPVVVDDAAVERWLASPGRQVVHRDTLGELLTALLTEPPGTRPPAEKLMAADGWTNPGASGWGGDRFFLVASGDDRAAAAAGLKDLRAVWVTAWDTEKDREEFVAALGAGNSVPNAAPARCGTRSAIVFAGFGGEERERLMEKLKGAPLPFTQAGRPWRE
jgi:hypothetical protein